MGITYKALEGQDMQLCSRCIQLTGMVIAQPQILKVFDGCDNCLDIKKKSFDIIEVVKQTLVQGK